eukprot:GHVP01070534.1.p1 GENE.GHVP01070534.1~~GHVP01070534.1.p1  ORF type:complete len:239 (+),score=42.88 GHVP01070534.1:197-913(+)
MEIGSESLPQERILEAAKTLRKHVKNNNPGNALLAPVEDTAFFIGFSVFNPKFEYAPLMINLPHKIRSETPKVCLIVTSYDHRMRKAELKEKIPGLEKVMHLEKLKAFCRTQDDKRKLCKSFDLFLVDRKLIGLMGGILGSPFISSKKMPLPIDLDADQIQAKISDFSSGTLYHPGKSPYSAVKVGEFGMKPKQIASNCKAVLASMVEYYGKRDMEIRSIHLRAHNSISLPLFVRTQE